jgi:tRNA wybutosine-synthesizing protein 1
VDLTQPLLVSKPTLIFGDEQIHILYGTQKGRCRRYAELLSNDAIGLGYSTKVYSMDQYDFDAMIGLNKTVILVISTYTNGKPPENAAVFYECAEDAVNDFRVPRSLLEGLSFSVFGCGNNAYGNNFNKTGRDMHKFLKSLRARSLVPLGLGNEEDNIDEQFNKWSKGLWRAYKRDLQRKEEKIEEMRNKQSETNNAKEESISEDDDPESVVLDLEDLGIKGENVDQDTNEQLPLELLTKEMLTPQVRQSLTKQGYKILGSHSGVKLCRWTKSMLRGRGGCYKHTFYGISSFQCMEMTPSLACANKCVFCWRHHSNPVSKTWKWKVDSPQFLVESAMENHKNLIKGMKGVPGVIEERYDEGMAVIRHCALSLVGEPIIYPYINEFVDLLHEKGISTFLVTNAQFPDKIENLKPVTQLYLSIDASTKESLKNIDRPLFEDYWERFIGSIEALSKKGQRTVFRLTLVKDWNMDEIENYAQLVHRGRPDFVEIKGVTYCGKNDTSNLTIKNTPFHEEVKKFTNQLLEEILKLSDDAYGLACEHEHSLCILLANKNKFYSNGIWNTWIDYKKFNELVLKGEEFSSIDYMQATPNWALSGANEKGFDPEDERFTRKKKKPPEGGC